MKKKINLYLYSIILTLIFSVSYSQTTRDIYNPISKTPEVSSINKFIQTPVNMGTGIPEINIPLYNIEQGECSLPISLNYHAGGIKVDEMASSVGLGWSLNAGGIVSRTVRKEPDESGGGYYTVHGWANRRPIGGYMPPGFCSTYPCAAYWDQQLHDNDDTEPDFFNFSFSGYSGKFLFDKNRKAQIIPEQNLKIEWPQPGSFKFTTTNGTIYIFSAIDRTTTYGIHVTQNETTSAWHLTKIITPNLKEINLEYQGYGYQTQELEPENINAHSCNDFNSPLINLMKFSINGSIIKKIYTNICEVNFNYKSSVREDILPISASAYALDNITIINKIGNKILKKYNFNTSYFLCNGVGTTVNYHQNLQTYLSKRLRLDAITEMDMNGKTLPPYTFNYNKFNIVPNLPMMVATGQDHWGLYNGKNENQTLIANPSTNPIAYFNSCTGFANRDVDIVYNKAFILDEIIYPVAGKTKYIYENSYFSNYGSNMGGLRIKSITNTPSNGQFAIEKLYEYGTPYLTGGPPIYMQQVNPDVSSVPGNPIIYGTEGPSDLNTCLVGPAHFIVMSNPINFNSEISSNYVIYDYVIEKQTGNGLIENQYDVSSLEDEIDLVDVTTYPYIPKSPILLSGKLISQKVKDDNGNIIRETNYTYASYIRYAVNMADALRVSYANCYETLYPYFLLTGASYLTQQVDIINGINNTKQFFYNGIPNNVSITYSGNINLFLSKTIEINSKGETKTTNLKYPFDNVLVSPYDEMVNRNIISPVIEQTVVNNTLNNLELQKSKVNYALWPNISNGFILPSNLQSSINGAPLKTNLVINKYDEKANILQTTDKAGIITSYIYGYYKTYPVAQVVGSTYDIVNSYLTNSTILNSPLATDVQMRTELNKIRLGLAGTKALVTTYTYNPLIGITSQTDPNGRTNFYEYDGFNRLTLIRKQDGNIVKKICYKYDGQPEDCGQ